MRIVITCSKNDFIKVDALTLLQDAFDKALSIVEKEDNDTYKYIEDNVENCTPVSVVVDFGFKVKDEQDPLILSVNDEVLTFKFVASDGGNRLELEGDNIETPMFSDKDAAIVRLSEGLKPVKETLDTSNAKLMFADTVGGIDMKVFDNGNVKYYSNGNLVQETIVDPDKLDAFILELQDKYDLKNNK